MTGRSVAQRLVDELGLPDGTPLVSWCTSWAGAGTAGQVVDDQLTDALAGYAVTHGRGDPFGNVEATTCTVQLVHQLAGRIPAVGEPARLSISTAVGDALGLDDGSRPRFTGEVLDRQVDDDGVLTVQLVGRRSRLGRLYVGDTPWPAELDGARVQRILDLAQQQLPALQLGTVDAGTVQVLARDVDRQPALGLLDELAESCAGQLVEHRTGELAWHDAEHRRNLPTAAELVAGREVLAGLRWASGLDGMVNDLTLSWGTSEPQQVVRVIDDNAVARVGPLAATLGTVLADEVEADQRARLMVGRRSTELWEAPALTVELLRTVDRAKLLQLLAVEHGALLRVTGLPALGPFTHNRLAVEGYTETLTRTSWLLQLAVADLGIAGAPIRWGDVPAGISWAELAQQQPDMTWLQAARWQPDPDQQGRWLDQPADLTWQHVDPALTWATYPTE